MKTYSTVLIKQLQEKINNAAVTVQTYKDYTFLKKINSAGISLHFSTDPSTGKRSYTMYLKQDMNKDFISKWRSTTAAGYFLADDYINDKRDFIGNTLYHKVTFTDANNVKYKVLVRLLNEITSEDITEEQKNEYITKYSDIQIDNHFFSIIKLTIDDGLNSWAARDHLTNVKVEKVEDYDSNIIEDATDLTENKEDDDNLMSPLF